jgi:uncharacterized protein (DUF779 family)
MQIRGGGGAVKMTFRVLALAGTLIATGWTVDAGAAGILPPNNPSANIAPSSSDFLTSIDTARAAEGVAPMAISEGMVESLPIPEQVFIIVNLERVDRGEPPIEYMTSELSSYAQTGANEGTDPPFPSTLTGVGAFGWGGAIWAGGVSNVIEADYYWMYDDGWGGLLSATSNAACNLLNLGECWGHRDIILHQYANCPDGSAPVLSMGAAYSQSGYIGGSMAGEMVSDCSGVPSDVTMTWDEVYTQVVAAARVIGIAAMPNGQGYWEAQADGDVTAFGSAQNYGSMVGQTLNSPIVGIATTPSGLGYWLVAADGGIFNFGNAVFYGSAGALPLVQPIVGMTSTPDGRGYWLVASDGGIFAYGDAHFHGSMGGKRLNQPIVGMAADQQTGGYWLVASDGGIFSFGAPFFGSTGDIALTKPIVGMEALESGTGYRFEASDGGVFDFGQAVFEGSMGGTSLVAPVVGMVEDLLNGGYWLVAQDGGIFNFGGAPYLGRLLL